MRNSIRVILLTLSLAWSVGYARVPISVSETFSTIVVDRAVSFPGKDSLAATIYPSSQRVSYLAFVEASGPGITVLTYRTADTDRKDFSKPTSSNEVNGRWVRVFDYAERNTSGTAILVKAANKKPIRARLRIIRFYASSVEQRTELERVLRFPLDILDSALDLPSFKVMVKPCGEVNAYSAPDITICTELISDLIEKGAADAIPLIALHEVGHTLLKLWGLPGWDIEDMVDDFAASLLATSRPEALRAMVRWLKSQDSLSVAAAQLSNDVRHGVPIQRARNIERILADANAATRSSQGPGLSPNQVRWLALLAQHIKPQAETVVSRRLPGETKAKDTGAAVIELEASGTCDWLTIAGADLTKTCDTRVRRTIYPSGRTAIYVATLNGGPLILSTAPEMTSPDGSSSSQIETVAAYVGAGQGIEYLSAKGLCSIARGAKANTLQCDLATEKGGIRSGVRFRFQNWNAVTQPDQTTPGQIAAGGSKPRDAQPSTTTVVEAQGTCKRLTMGGADLTSMCGNRVQRTTYPTGRTAFVVSTKHNIPLIVSTAPPETVGDDEQSFSIETVGVYHGEGQGTEYLAARGRCAITPAGKTMKTFQCELSADRDGARSNVTFQFKEWAAAPP